MTRPAILSLVLLNLLAMFSNSDSIKYDIEILQFPDTNGSISAILDLDEFGNVLFKQSGEGIEIFDGREYSKPFSVSRSSKYKLGPEKTITTDFISKNGDRITIDNNYVETLTSDGSKIILGSQYYAYETLDINDNGSILGRYQDEVNGRINGTVYKNGVYDTIDTGYNNVSYNAINNSQSVVGVIKELSVGYVYKDGQTSLLSGSIASSAIDINNDGIIVGSFIDDGQPVAGLWTETGGWLNLNKLIPEDFNFSLEIAQRINDKGDIAGRARLGDGSLQAFLLSASPQPVPEPSTLLFFFFVLVLFSTYRLQNQTARRLRRINP